MFWLSRKTFVGSYSSLSATSRAYVSAPYDDRAASGVAEEVRRTRGRSTRRRPRRSTARAQSVCARPCGGVVPAGDRVEHERHRALGERRRALGARAPTAPPIWWTWISHCGPGAVEVELAEPRRSARRRAATRFVALKYAWMPFGQSGSISDWIIVYGIGPSRSAIGSATSRNVARRAPRPRRRARRDGDERRDLLAVPLLRDHRQRRRGRQVDERGDLVGRVRRPVAERAQQVAGGVGRVEDRPGVDDRPERVQLRTRTA